MLVENALARVTDEPRSETASQSLESNVRSYPISFPAVFSRARGSIMLTDDGRKIIDFLSGAGALNYGHNNHQIRAAITEYLASDAVVHGLDLATPAKLEFMETFNAVILRERGLRYRFQFTGPTGANAIEAALKLSRKVTGRQNIISFTNGFHGMSLGASAVTARRSYRAACGIPLSGATFVPYDGFLGPAVDTAEYLGALLSDDSGGIDAPAAILVETVQGEGGINVARKEWLQSIQAIAKSVGALFIIDDIQMGCGRTGDFFSFEFAGISPDMVVMSKSLSGYGVPLSMLLIKEEHDAWRPGEHTGTFRGNNLALVSATAAINIYWRSRTFAAGVRHMGEAMRRRLDVIASKRGHHFSVRGRGMALGFDCKAAEIAEATARKAFQKGLMIERCGPNNQVIKFLPALTIDLETLNQGLDIFERSLAETLDGSSSDLVGRSSGVGST
ncbi:diaminobutyrate--2-oxoglutarate transaminase [Bradyrhizobium sp. USDA 4520]